MSAFCTRNDTVDNNSNRTILYCKRALKDIINCSLVFKIRCKIRDIHDLSGITGFNNQYCGNTVLCIYLFILRVAGKNCNSEDFFFSNSKLQIFTCSVSLYAFKPGSVRITVNRVCGDIILEC